MNSLQGWKTRLFGIFIIILGAVESSPDFINLIPPALQGIVMSCIGIGILVLRELTKTPAGQAATSASVLPTTVTSEPNPKPAA